MPVAVLSNLNSRRNRRHAEAVRNLLANRGDTIHVETRDTADLASALASLREQSVSHLAINGGDGTAQHVLTVMLNGIWPDPPTLAILPGGTTNMTAHDVNGGRLGLLPALRAFLRLTREAAPSSPRHLVRVQCPGRDDQYGFFFGMGAVVQGIQYCHERIYRLGLSDEIAPGFALLRAFYGMARREPVFSEGVPMTLRGAGLDREQRTSILCVSALSRLFLGMTPFWGDGSGRLAVTLVRERPCQLLRTLPALLRGRPNDRLTAAAGYESLRLDDLSIASPGQFTLDGEIFPAAAQPLAVSAAGPLALLPLALPPQAAQPGATS